MEIKYGLSNLIDVNVLQHILDDLNRMTGIVGSIFDNNGVIIGTFGSHNVCMRFHRKNPKSLERCNKSDACILKTIQQTRRLFMRRCGNGLIDAGYPIVMEGNIVGTVFNGQIFTENPDMDFFSKQADEFGFDKNSYLEAIKDVPIIPEDKFKWALNFTAGLLKLLRR